MIPFMASSYLYHTFKLITYHVNSPSQHKNMQLEAVSYWKRRKLTTTILCSIMFLLLPAIYPFIKILSKVTSCVKVELKIQTRKILDSCGSNSEDYGLLGCEGASTSLHGITSQETIILINLLTFKQIHCDIFNEHIPPS